MIMITINNAKQFYKNELIIDLKQVFKNALSKKRA